MSVEARTETKYRGFSEEALRELSLSRGEPEWFRERRLEAWRIYEQTPFPGKKDEVWRRTDVSMLELGQLEPFAELAARSEDLANLPAAVRPAVEGTDGRGGLLVHRNSSSGYMHLSDDLAAKGVILADLGTAVREHPDLLKEHFGKLVTPMDGKYAALHYAFFSGGVVVYVPRNVEVELPLQSLTWSDRTGLAVMPHTLVVVESGGSLVLVDEFASNDEHGPAMANSVAELSLGAGSQVKYVALQRWGTGVFNFSNQRAAIGRDASFTSLSVVLGSRVTKSWVDSRLVESGGNAQMIGIMFADGNQRFHHHTLQDHQGPNGSSDLLYKVALTDHARSEFSGLIRVHKNAFKTDAYQANRNLALSSHARADSMPKLEIENNDVRCTHGATVGPIDEEQLFYLMARGIPHAEAEHMMVEGFFQPVMERIPLEAVKERVRAAVDAKLSARAR